MKIIGKGIFNGLLVTLNHFFKTYTDDLFTRLKGLSRSEVTQIRSSARATGLFTVEYPEQKITPPEEYRMIPFLVYEPAENGERNYRCTACGICSKVCPTQCI